ncbi:hypothetical protein BKA83DRAFT_4505353 [Pisolithus microcarpus]|nr:hypothetical protein BKA83DRAFT_4505353 [Pisolithus microcarpus]
MCLLIENHEELFPVLSTFLRQPHLDCGPLAFVEGDLLSIPALDTTRLQRLLLAYYRLLRANRLLPSELFWPASALSSLFTSEAPHLDLQSVLAIQCYALHTGMAEVERSKLEQEYSVKRWKRERESFGMAYDPSGMGKRRFVDARVMPALEMKRIHEVRTAMMIPHDFYALEEGDVSQRISESDLSLGLSTSMASSCLKIPLHQSPRPKSSSPFRHMCPPQPRHACSLRLPTLISSPPSSGKSLFLTHLASMLCPDTLDLVGFREISGNRLGCSRAIVRMYGNHGSGNNCVDRADWIEELEKFFTRIRGLVPSADAAMEVDGEADEDEGGDEEGITLPAIFPNLAVREEMYLEARDSSDLLGGFKPVDARVPAGELSVRFMELFGATFSRKRNVKFEESVRKAVQEGKWKRAVVLWKEATRLAKERIEGRVAEGAEEEADVGRDGRAEETEEGG